MSESAEGRLPSVDELRRTSRIHIACVAAPLPLRPAEHLHPMLMLLLGRYNEREHHVRESWVKAMEARLVREELKKCYRGEGVNHMQNCKDLAERYALMIRDNAVSIQSFA